MTIQQLALQSRPIHALTNTILLGNRRSVRGADNQIEGMRAPLMMHSCVHVRGSGNHIRLGSGVLTRAHIRVLGDHNVVTIGDDVRLSDAMLWIKANGAHLTIAGGNRVNNCEMGIEGDGGRITLARGAHIGGFVWLDGMPNDTEKARLYAGTEPIEIGAGTCVSDDVVIRSTDSHDILTLDGEVINAPEGVRVGERCWVCSGALLLKGSAVGDECVIGARCVLNRNYADRANVLLAGTPAKVVRERITWRL